MNHYEESWKIYKAHSEEFKDDLGYYLEFCRNYKTLELFAGYGRLSNFLIENKVELETVELEKNFAKFINLDDRKNHVANVLYFSSQNKFERIIAGYNSFCLLLNEEDIYNFFLNLDKLLVCGGKVSLSYYHPDFWKEVKGYNFNLDGKNIKYVPSYDLTQLNKHRATWIDEYHYDGKIDKYSYPVKVYLTEKYLIKYIDGTSLEWIETVYDYNNTNISEPGWREYI